MLSKRDNNVGIIFSGPYPNGQGMNYEICEGDNVILKIKDESILVRNIQILATGEFRGEIYGFEPSFSEEFKGYCIGQQINFLEENIISCGKS